MKGSLSDVQVEGRSGWRLRATGHHPDSPTSGTLIPSDTRPDPVARQRLAAPIAHSLSVRDRASLPIGLTLSEPPRIDPSRQRFPLLVDRMNPMQLDHSAGANGLP